MVHHAETKMAYHTETKMAPHPETKMAYFTETKMAPHPETKEAVEGRGAAETWGSKFSPRKFAFLLVQCGLFEP